MENDYKLLLNELEIFFDETVMMEFWNFKMFSMTYSYHSTTNQTYQELPPSDKSPER